MGAPTSPTVRAAIIRSVDDEHLTYEETAALLGVGRATVNRVLRLHRETGSVDAQPRGGGSPSPIVGEVADQLHEIVTSMPDGTVAEMMAVLVRRSGLETSLASMRRALERLGYSRKKRPSSPASATRRSTVKRAARFARS
jgi:transposase